MRAEQAAATPEMVLKRCRVANLPVIYLGNKGPLQREALSIHAPHMGSDTGWSRRKGCDRRIGTRCHTGLFLCESAPTGKQAGHEKRAIP